MFCFLKIEVIWFSGSFQKEAFKKCSLGGHPTTKWYSSIQSSSIYLFVTSIAVACMSGLVQTILESTICRTVLWLHVFVSLLQHISNFLNFLDTSPIIFHFVWIKKYSYFVNRVLILVWGLTIIVICPRWILSKTNEKNHTLI